MVQQPDQLVAATYSRISNPNDDRDASLDTQEEAQVELWEGLGYSVPPENRLRERYTGMESIYDRPVLNQLRDLVASGRVRGVSAYDTDRLARDPQELLTIVRDNFKNKVETKFVKCDHATQGRIGEMILYMKGFASALEYDAIRDRTMRGKKKILSLGQWVGDGKPKYGFVFLKDESGRRRAANPQQAPVVRRMFEMAADGHSSPSIADTLNRERIPTSCADAGHARPGRRWYAATVARILRDRTYIGEARAGVTVRVEGRYGCGKPRRMRRPAHEHVILHDSRTEPLVSPDLFERANLMLDSLRTRPAHSGRKAEFLLRGHIFCGTCGGRLTPQVDVRVDSRSGKDAPYKARSYRCVAHRRRPEVACKAAYGAQWVEHLGWNLLLDYLKRPGLLERLMEEEIVRLESEDGCARIEADLARGRERRRKIGQMMARAVDAKIETDDRIKIKIYEEKLESLAREADGLDKHIAGLQHQIGSRGERRRAAEGTLSVVDKIRSRLRDGEPDDPEKRDFIETLDVLFFAWHDDGERCVRVEIPLGMDGVNLGAFPRESLAIHMVRLDPIPLHAINVDPL